MPITTTTLIRAACVAWLWVLPAPANADDTVQDDDAVPGHTGLTYFDLMKLVITDLKPGATPENSQAHAILPYRHIAGKGARTVPEGPVAIRSLEARQIHADGSRRLALVADLGESRDDATEFVLLALFEIGAKPKLLDVIEVGNDRMTGFADDPLRPLGRGTDLIQIDSGHFDASIDFVSAEFIFVRNDRFHFVDSLFTVDYSTCTYELKELPIVNTRADPGRPYDRIDIAVRESVTARAQRDHCNEKAPHPFVRTFRTAYRWNARRHAFATMSGDLKNLDKINAIIRGNGYGLPAR